MACTSSRGRGTRISPTSPLKWFQSLVLPWFTLALVSAAVYTRLTRGSMLDVLGEDYIRTARSKGLTERRVDLPARAAVGADPGGQPVRHRRRHSRRRGHPHRDGVRLPGLGYTSVQAIEQQDLPVIIGIVIVATTGVVLANIVVDLLYAVLDPRVRLH